MSIRGSWLRAEAQQSVAEAYAFVSDHGGLTTYLPCFCGCGKRNGHNSLDSCFVARRDMAGRVVSRESHAAT